MITRRQEHLRCTALKADSEAQTLTASFEHIDSNRDLAIDIVYRNVDFTEVRLPKLGDDFVLTLEPHRES